MATISSAVSWLLANWQPLVLAILAIDAALIPLFPNAGLLKSIQSALSALGAKPPTPPSAS